MLLRSLSVCLRWSSSPLLRTLVSSRSVHTSSIRRKDGDLDLDVWKSVMRSQALPEERASEAEADACGSDLVELRRLVETWQASGRIVPRNITDDQLQELAGRTSTSRKKYLKYLAIREGHKLSKKRKKELKRAEAEAQTETEAGLEPEEQQEPQNSFLLGFWNKAMERAQGWRAAQALRFGQPLVLDMSFEEQMSPRDLQNAVEQLQEAEGWNRRAHDPFHLHFCGLRPDGAFARLLLQRYGPDAWHRLPISVSARPHADIFSPADLVYLTPDSRNVLNAFDHSKVYIVGALVDRSVQTGVTLASAKRQRLTTARLPLQEHLHWGSGAKSLTLDQMIRILGSLKETGSWHQALEFVPKRKHGGFHEKKQSRSGSSSAARVYKKSFAQK